MNLQFNSNYKSLKFFSQNISNKISQFWILRLNFFFIILLHLKLKEVL
jgi:hypothetical protein